MCSFLLICRADSEEDDYAPVPPPRARITSCDEAGTLAWRLDDADAAAGNFDVRRLAAWEVQSRVWDPATPTPAWHEWRDWRRSEEEGSDGSDAEAEEEAMPLPGAELRGEALRRVHDGPSPSPPPVPLLAPRPTHTSRAGSKRVRQHASEG